MPTKNWLSDIAPTAKELYELYDDVRLFEKNNPILFTVTNANPPATSNRAVLLGANSNRFLPNNGNVVDISIVYGYNSYSYEELLANTMNAPFQIGTIRLEEKQKGGKTFVGRNYDFEVTVQSPDGTLHTIALPVFKALNQFVQDAIEMDVEDLKIPIDGDTLMQINVAAGSSLKFFLYPSKSTSLKMLITNGTLAKKYSKINIPLTPNRDSTTSPLQVKMNDSSKRLVI